MVPDVVTLALKMAHEMLVKIDLSHLVGFFQPWFKRKTSKILSLKKLRILDQLKRLIIKAWETDGSVSYLMNLYNVYSFSISHERKRPQRTTNAHCIISFFNIDLKPMFLGTALALG